MSLNLAIILETRAASQPDHTAMLHNGNRLSYGQLNSASSHLASGLVRLGLSAGDKVALLLPNVPEFVIAYFAILKLGGCVVPLNTMLKASEIAYQVEDSDASALIVHESLLPEAKQGLSGLEVCHHSVVVGTPSRPDGVGKRAPAGCRLFSEVMETSVDEFDTVQTSPQDTAVILYTAGVTGHPKGAELTHFNMFYNAALTADHLCKLTDQDVSLAALPLFHAFGQTCVMNATLYAGGVLVLVPRFEPDKALQLIQRHGVSVLLGVPTMYWYLQHYPGAEKYDWSSLRLCCSGGAALPVQLMEQFRSRYGRPIIEGYGLSETSPVASFNPTEKEPRPGSIGLPIYGVEMRVLDEEDRPLPPGVVGEIVIRGHNVMKGYYKRPAPTAEAMRNGWFHTGDLGRVDEHGYYYVVGRKKDFIIRGGLNIYAREVEDVLLAHPAVAEAAVVGVPDEVMGEEVKAFVVLEQDEAVDADDLIEYARSRMAAYKYPRFIEFCTELPKDATGRVIKRLLKS